MSNVKLRPLCPAKQRCLLGSLFIIFVVGVAGATDQRIQPSGNAVGLDKQSNAVYQVHANGIKIGYKLIGSGDPLVMLMGLGGTMDRWPEGVVETLSKKYQLIILDNRGMGYTTADATTFTCKLLADDVIGLLDALKVTSANVLGFSMGSMITQELLLEYPHRVNKAVVYATSTDGSKVVEALKGKTPDEPTILNQLEATIHWKTPLGKLPFITNQILVVVGTADTVVGIESSKTLALAVPGAWLVQFKKATHHLMFEAPVELAKLVSAFLEINETVDVK